MPAPHSVSCSCGSTTFALEGAPILVVECLCDSCRKAGAMLEALEGAPPLLDEKGATLELMYRKDKLRCTKGAEHLREFRLSPDAPTRRVVATCCNAAMLLEFIKGHWIDIYGMRLPLEQRPAAQMRTMVGDLPGNQQVPGDIPNLKTHNLRFYAKLMGAWIAMGFRTPEIDYIRGKLQS